MDAQVGHKNDIGKIRWQFLPWGEVEDIARVMDFGAIKYSPFNWQIVVAKDKERYFDATMRHITAWKKGELVDNETGSQHLAHAVCCLLFLMWNDKNGSKNEA